MAFGIGCALLAGIGRYWDNPQALWWQALGLGSVIYIFFLALVLWWLIWLLCPKNWSYRGVLTFVGLTSPLGFLYAIPVERWFSLDTAQDINLWFLAVVALWRVVLLVLYLKRSAGFNAGSAVLATLLPLTLIVTVLSILNLEHVAVRIMAGLSEDERSPNDAAYTALFLLTVLSFYSLPILLMGYGVLGSIRWRRHKRFPGEPTGTQQEG